MSKGDHLIVSCGTYTHHAIDLGDNRVIQYGTRASLGNLCIEIADMETFSQGNHITINNKPALYSPDEIIKRAMARLGEQDYSLFSNNCEHFVNWCRTGEAVSRQVERIKEISVSNISKIAILSASKAVTKNGTTITAKTLTNVASPWLLVADAAQLSTEVLASNMGISDEDAKRTGQVVGFSTSVGIGAAVAGPIGAGVGFAFWTLGEVVTYFMEN